MSGRDDLIEVLIEKGVSPDVAERSVDALNARIIAAIEADRGRVGDPSTSSEDKQ